MICFNILMIAYVSESSLALHLGTQGLLYIPPNATVIWLPQLKRENDTTESGYGGSDIPNNYFHRYS